MNIDFALINEVTSFKQEYREVYMQIIKETCQQLNITEDMELSCIFVDDKKIHQINKEYRQVDRPTDVISFALEDNDVLLVEGMPRSLGDIFISIDRAKVQAEQYGHSIKREMCFLFTHGLLHLLGFDHIDEKEEKEMFEMQDTILDALEIGRRFV
jgi:probable rRNA maturation factor